MARLDYWISRWPVVVVTAMIVLSSSGCVGLAAQIMYLWKGNKQPAETHCLENQRVAVVCVSKASAYGNGTESEALARMVGALLGKEVKDIEMVRYTEVKDWIDNNDWDYIDYKAIGKGVKADMLVAIDLSNISYHEGQTLYRGHADYSITVYNMTKGGKVEWSDQQPDFNYPREGGRPSTEMSEPKFKQMFLRILADDIARNFYDYEKILDVASDARLLE